MSDTFSKRLKEAMKIRNIKQVELSQKSGISKSSLSEYLKGKYEAKQTGLYHLAKALDINEVWLMGEDVPMDRDYGRTKVTEIDVINLTTNEIIQKLPYTIQTDALNKTEDFFAVYASDNSMAPLLDTGDIAIIQKNIDFTSGGTYLIRLKSGFPIIRKVIELNNNSIELQAMNMWNFPVQTGLKKEDIEILGKVIKAENQSAFK